MFSIASRFAAGTVSRQLAWIFLGGLAIITFAVGLSQPEMEEADPVLKLAGSRSVDEETSLLGNDGEAASDGGEVTYGVFVDMYLYSIRLY
jgi:hypothetical protein